MTNNWQRWKGIMKAYPFEESRLAKWQPPFIVQPKYDGVRCRVIPVQNGRFDLPTKGNYLLLSSEENLFFSVPHLNDIFNQLDLKAELDGELYCHGMTFEHISSITSRTANLHPDSTHIQFHCFDIVIDNVPQMKRQLGIEKLRGRSPWLVIAPFYFCETLDEVTKAYDSYLAQGYEGIIVRNAYAPYERKRSTWVMKFKPKQEDTYEIVGFQEEVDKDGLPKGRLGAIVCASGDGNTFNVGTGFTSLNREYIWKHKDTLLGAKTVVKYQHITSGNKVPRFPVFVEVIVNEREPT